MADQPAWPRVGQKILTRHGKIGDVVVVLRGVEALRPKTEIQILELVPSMMASLGSDWMNRYYEATIQLPTMEMVIVTPRDVDSILDGD
jgi:hypothetical protein